MKIVVDAMTADYGGIRTYVEHLAHVWGDLWPADEFHLVVPEDSTLPTGDHPRHVVRIPRPATVGRPWAQSRHLARIAREVGADAVLGASPSTTMVHPGRPFLYVIYDLRHELLPEQFTPRQRLLRRVSYGRAYRIADGFVSISQRSLDDLHTRHPRLRSTPARVTHLGADHVKRWEPAARPGPAVTFAHHSNKNPDLILDGWSELAARGGDVPDLLVLGVGSLRERLTAAIDERGLGTSITLAPFLPDEDFQRVMAEARIVVFPTTFEGFGLPVVEAMHLGIPVVIGPERATTEIAGGHAFRMDAFTPTDLADAVLAAAAQTDTAGAAARGHAERFTWERTARQTREMLQQLCS